MIHTVSNLMSVVVDGCLNIIFKKLFEKYLVQMGNEIPHQAELTKLSCVL